MLKTRIAWSVFWAIVGRGNGGQGGVRVDMTCARAVFQFGGGVLGLWALYFVMRSRIKIILMTGRAKRL